MDKYELRHITMDFCEEVDKLGVKFKGYQMDINNGLDYLVEKVNEEFQHLFFNIYCKYFLKTHKMNVLTEKFLEVADNNE